MAGETAFDTSVAIRYLNGDPAVVEHVLALPSLILPLPVVAELLFGAENSARRLQNMARYLQFIEVCTVEVMSRETASFYAQARINLKRKGRPIPENDLWIAAQCLEKQWVLVTDDQHFDYVDGLVLEHW